MPTAVLQRTDSGGRSAYRFKYTSDSRVGSFGFRLCIDPVQVEKKQEKAGDGGKNETEEDKVSNRLIFGVVKEVDEKSILLTNVSSKRDRSTSKKPPP